jgi:UDP-2,3-diacylglucosamine hydrolase
MAERKGVYFVSDVHLGLDVKDPAAREARFVSFLRGIPADTTLALYLLGDIWDFWYEYRDVVPKGYVRVFSALMDLMDAGVKVYFFPGNHDIWCYSYFESLGMTVVREQPQLVEVGGKVFCLGHGDGLGPGMRGYKFMNSVFKCRFIQRLFSTLHPWLAYRLGLGWSRRSRLARN